MKQKQVRQNKNKKGQTLVLFCLMVPVFFGMAGLSIDSGLDYRTSAMLSRGVDAAALRLVGNYQQPVSFRQNVALGIMQTNVPEFMQGTNAGNWTDLSGNTGGNANFGNASSTGGETMLLSSNDKIPSGYPRAGQSLSSMKMITNVDDNTGVMTVTLTATVTHENYFMQIFGSQFRYYQTTNTTTVNRFPAVNILVLDISASMYGNGGALGIMGDGTAANTGAVMLFASQFDESRDYLMVVAFSSRASVIWPTAPQFADPNGIPYFGPAKNFISGFTTSSGVSVPGIQTVMQNYMAYCSVDGQGTNGEEGLHYAAENVQKWLNYTVNSTVSQNLFRINYVFMTDGGFNLMRTYAIGPGFGLPNNGSGGASSATTSRLSVHNTFHDYAPLVGDCIGQSNGLDSITSWNGYSLSGLFGTYGKATSMPGVNVNIYPTDISSNTKVWVPQNLNTNYTSATNYANNAARQSANNGNPFWPLALLSPKDATGFYKPLNLYTSNTNTLNTSIINEQDKMAMKDPNTGRTAIFNRLILPLQIVTPLQNPARGTDFYLPANGAPTTNVAGNNTTWSQQNSPGGITRNGYNYIWLPQTYYQNYASYYVWLFNNNKVPNTVQDLALTDSVMDSFPVGSFFANHAGTVLQEMQLDPSETYGSFYAPSKIKNPYIFWPGNVEGYYSRSARMTDFYPDYTMVGDATILASSGSSSSNANAAVSYWWSFQNRSWQSASNNTTNESYWLADAQAFILRYKDTTGNSGYNGLPSGQNATFYVIKYGTANANLDAQLKNMANDPVNSSFYDRNQNPGQFFGISNASTSAQAAILQQTFQQIAEQIAVRISK